LAIWGLGALILFASSAATPRKHGTKKHPSAARAGHEWTVYLQVGGDKDGKDGPHLAVSDPEDADATRKEPHVNGQHGDRITFVAMDADFRVVFDQESPLTNSTGVEVQCFDVQKGPKHAKSFLIRDSFPGCGPGCCRRVNYHVERLTKPWPPLPDCPKGAAPIDCTGKGFKEIGPWVDGDG
jgi:hypothetical protein